MKILNFGSLNIDMFMKWSILQEKEKLFPQAIFVSQAEERD